MEIPYRSLLSYYDGNEEQRAQELVQKIQDEHLTLALVSDAGTPAIADPGFRLIKLAHERGIPVRTIPGPSTLSALISVSGLPSDRVLFVGFLARKKNQLVEDIRVWRKSRAAVVAFEAPNRLMESLDVFQEQIPQARLCIGRELTKLHEEVHLFTLPEAKKWAEEHTHLKGELALMLDLGMSEEESVDEEWEPILKRAKFLFEKGLTAKDLVEFFTDQVQDKKELYKRILQIKRDR